MSINKAIKPYDPFNPTHCPTRSATIDAILDAREFCWIPGITSNTVLKNIQYCWKEVLSIYEQEGK